MWAVWLLSTGQNLEPPGRQASGNSTRDDPDDTNWDEKTFPQWETFLWLVSWAASAERRKWAGTHICSECCSDCAVGCCSKLLLPSFPCGDGPRLKTQAKINALSLKLFLSEQFITTTGSRTQTSCDYSVLQPWTQASPWRNTGWVNDGQDVSPCLAIGSAVPSPEWHRMPHKSGQSELPTAQKNPGNSYHSDIEKLDLLQRRMGEQTLPTCTPYVS